MSKKPDDASRIGALANILQVGNKQKTPQPLPPSPALPHVATQPTPAVPDRPRRAKVGKSSDPNWHHYGVYLRKDTHRKAVRLLEDTESGKDMSELLQELLEQWLASH